MLKVIVTLLAIGLWVPFSVGAADEKPYSSDKDTVLLLHLDGNANDASECGNNGMTTGETAWGEGRFGQALLLEGKGGIEIAGGESLTPADQSWTIEAWIKPAEKQPAHAYILSSGFAHATGYGLRISYNKQLVGQFMAANKGVGVGRDAATKLFDGQWHHVATVLDRGANGAIRLYLDGEDVTSEPDAQPQPINEKGQTTSVCVGVVNGWTLNSGFVGLIDELRVSRGVRDAYKVKAAEASKPNVAKP